MASWVNFGRGTLWITWLGSCQEFETLLEYFFLIFFFFFTKTCNVKANESHDLPVVKYLRSY